MRMKPRHVLLLTERRIPRDRDGDESEGPEGARDLIDLMTDMLAQGDEEGAQRLAENTVDDDLEPDMGYYEDDADYEQCEVGVIAEVGQYISRPGGQNHVILNGVARGRVEEIIQDQPFVAAQVRRQEEPTHDPAQTEAAMQTVLEQVESYISMLPNVPEEVLTMVKSVDEPGWLADLIAFSPEFTSDQRQDMVETIDPLERLRKISVLIQKRLNVLNLRQEIQSEAQAGMDKQQREYFLREQLRAIQKELGEGSAEEALANEIREKIEAAGMPDEVNQKAMVQVERLEQQHPFSPEIGVIRTYLEWLTDLPWAVETEDRLDLDEAARILDEDHYGLDKVKDRIVEYIAVLSLKKDLRGPILCFVGPPGTGKTSLGRSIARALGRKFERISLGGIRDEAEIRGHRRTYVGALPGRIIQEMRRAGTRNPVFVLDEVDKVGTDFRGDPSSALLEVLDPEQNSAFSDHYLEVPFDLSQVLFIATANLMDPVPPALRDRMEVIELPGYTHEEKLEIARRFLLPRQRAQNGVADVDFEVSDAALGELIRSYTREAGVRNLEREIGALCRKVARRVAEEGVSKPVRIGVEDLEGLLGPVRFEPELVERAGQPGVAVGLAWTPAGGDILFVESSRMPGKGELKLTGSLGDVMRESAEAARSWLRARAADLGLDPETFQEVDLHLHVPAGAVPKDGPSAGVAMVTSLTSLMTGRAGKPDVAMTGEITLRGKVLPVGGIKEKVLAAKRAGIATVVLPERNRKDVEEIEPELLAGLALEYVGTIDDALRYTLAPAH
jgi:ATP-dependent Lon protease